MRIVYVTAMMPFGSQEAFVVPEVGELLRQGHQVTLVPRSKHTRLVHRDADALQAITIAEPLLSPRVLRQALAELIRRPRTVLRALGGLLASGPLRHLPKNLAVFPKALWLAGLVRRNGLQHIHAHWALTTATLAMIASQVSGIPWSFTAHRGDIVDDNLLSRKIRSASFARFISESGLQLAEAIAGRMPDRQTPIIHMGVAVPDVSGVAPGASWPATILCPANLLPVKGHRYLLQAISILKERGRTCTLFVAGDGPLRSALEAEAKTLGIEDGVTFLGQVPHDAILSRYRGGQVGVVVLPSLDLGGGVHEGIPVALIEALACGVPVVSTATGGIPELLRGGAGLLVPPADAAALAEALERLLTDGELRRRLSAAGRKHVLAEFAADRVVATLVDYFEAAERQGEPAAPTAAGGRRISRAA